MPTTKRRAVRQPRSSVASQRAAARLSVLEVLESTKLEALMDIATAMEKMRRDARAVCAKSDEYIDNMIQSFEGTGLLDRNFLEVMGEKEPEDPYRFSGSSSASGSTAPSTDGPSCSTVASTAKKQTRGRPRAPKKTPAEGTKPRAKKGVKRTPSDDSRLKGRNVSGSLHRSMRTPTKRARASSQPVITPKFVMRKGRLPSLARRAKEGEFLVSLSGSPVQIDHVAPPKPTLTLPLDNGKVLSIDPDNADFQCEGLGKDAARVLQKMQKTLTKYIETAGAP